MALNPTGLPEQLPGSGLLRQVARLIDDGSSLNLFAVTALPDPAALTNRIIRVTGVGPAFSDGIHWYPIQLGAAL